MWAVTGAISLPLRLHLGCGLELEQKHRPKENSLLGYERITMTILPFRGWKVFCVRTCWRKLMCEACVELGDQVPASAGGQADAAMDTVTFYAMLRYDVEEEL